MTAPHGTSYPIMLMAVMLLSLCTIHLQEHKTRVKGLRIICASGKAIPDAMETIWYRGSAIILIHPTLLER